MKTTHQAPQNRIFTTNYYKDVYQSSQYPGTTHKIEHSFGNKYFLKETPKKKVYEFIADYFAVDRITGASYYIASRKLKSYSHKYLCVGGPLDGTMDTEEEAKDYSFWKGRDKVSKKPRTILLWDKML